MLGHYCRDVPGNLQTSQSRILDAAESCFERMGVRKTTIDDVAAEAGVARITVYRNVGNRDQLVLKILLRVTQRFLDRTRPRVLAAPNLAGAVTELLLSTVSAARRDNSLLLLYASEENGEAGGPISGAVEPLVAMYGEVVAAAVERFPGELRSDLDAHAASEWTLRMIVSLLTLTSPEVQDNQGLRRYVETFVVPPLLAPNRARVGRAT
jgi:AcrR family transcriptional regulator